MLCKSRTLHENGFVFFGALHGTSFRFCIFYPCMRVVCRELLPLHENGFILFKALHGVSFRFCMLFHLDFACSILGEGVCREYVREVLSFLTLHGLSLSSQFAWRVS